MIQHISDLRDLDRGYIACEDVHIDNIDMPFTN